MSNDLERTRGVTISVFRRGVACYALYLGRALHVAPLRIDFQLTTLMNVTNHGFLLRSNKDIDSVASLPDWEGAVFGLRFKKESFGNIERTL